MMEILWIEETDSTNNWIKSNPDAVHPMTLVAAYDQTAGRGQRGNSWESEPGKNLTFSFYFTPGNVSPADQFIISEAVSLAMARSLSHFDIRAEVKWPNDIYVGDRKICGILIENSISSERISRCIVGIGLNVNQERFVSDAPNPVSMTMVTGEKNDLEEVLRCVGRHIKAYLMCLSDRRDLHREYRGNLWRRTGWHAFRDTATGEYFPASIEDVEPRGHLILRHLDSEDLRRYAFKEVEFIL